MARYYFDTIDGTKAVDDEGVELATLEDARVVSTKVLGEVLKHQPGEFWHNKQFRVIVREAEATRFVLYASVVEGADAELASDDAAEPD